MKLTRENIFTFLNLHLLLVAVLAVGNIVLLTRLVLAWNTLRTDRPEKIGELKTDLKLLQLQTEPLRGLPAKVDASNKQADKFYDNRIPQNYSTISAEVYDLGQKTNVRVSRLAYSHKPVFENLEEVALDASLSGEYAPIMRFINGLERDKVFFIINGLTFTGQQGGTVNVRLRVTTYIHASDANQLTPPATPESDTGESNASAALARITSNAGGQ